MNYYIKKYIEIKEFIIDILICCCHYINKKNVNIKYYNLDDFNMENNNIYPQMIPNENNKEIIV